MAANTLKGNRNNPKPRRTNLANKPSVLDRLVGYKQSHLVYIFTTIYEWIQKEAEREFDGWDLVSVERQRYKLRGIATTLIALKEGGKIEVEIQQCEGDRSAAACLEANPRPPVPV
jgi:hypothetical protein